MKYKFLTESLVLLEYLTARKNGFMGSYTDYVNIHIRDMFSTKYAENIKVNDSSIYSLITLNRSSFSYLKCEDEYFLAKPEGMSHVDALKVIAHNRKYYELYYSNCEQSVSFLTKRALVDQFEFKELSKEEVQSQAVFPLYFVKKYDMYFVHSHWFKSHTLWFEEFGDVREEEIADIYTKLDSKVAKYLKGQD